MTATVELSHVPAPGERPWIAPLTALAATMGIFHQETFLARMHDETADADLARIVPILFGPIRGSLRVGPDISPDAPEIARALCVFDWACGRADLLTANWFLRVVGLDRHDMAKTNYRAFVHACANDNIDMVRWLEIEAKIPSRGDFRQDALAAACRNGHLFMTLSLCSRSPPTDASELTPSYLWTEFEAACLRGSLPVAQLIASHDMLPEGDVRAHQNVLFRRVTRVGHDHVCRWLADHFGHPVRDTDALSEACRTDPLDAARWLLSPASSPGVIVCRASFLAALRGACGADDVMLARKVVIEGRIHLEGLRGDLPEMVKAAGPCCKMWLMETFLPDYLVNYTAKS